jgi:hypothetical protein
MSIPKFNLSKLKESVAKQQAVTKEDIRNLLLLDRLQSQIASQNSLNRSGFAIKGKRLTKRDKVDLKENPKGAIYNAFIDSIVENRDFAMHFNIYSDKPDDNQILKGSSFADSYHFFEEKLLENFSQFYLLDEGSYYERILFVDSANNRMINISLDQDGGLMEIHSIKLSNDRFYSLDNPTKKNTIETILSACKTEEARNGLLSLLNEKALFCETYFGFDNWQTFLFFPFGADNDPLTFDDMISELKYEFSFLNEKSFKDLEDGLVFLAKQFSPRVVQGRDIVNIQGITDVIT